jgi:hypothetical protein
MGRRNFSAFFICLLLLPLFSLPARAEISVKASLSSQSFPVDSAAKLTITVTGARSAEIEIKEIDGLQFHDRGQSSRINIINGNYSSSISSSYIVQPLQPGTYTIPPISITAGKETVQTEPITFKVTGIGQGSQSNNQNTNTSAGKNNIAFILVSEIGRHYTGEIVPLKIKAYFNRKYRWEPISSPPALKADGVVMSPLSNEPEQNQEQLKGVIYHVLSWDTNLSGIKAGRHPVLFELDATLLLQQQRTRSPFGGNSPFGDSIFDSVFGGLQRKPIQLISPELHFEAAELPEKGRPENFSGAIGDFQLTVSASPKQVEIGEPITLTMEIAGKGNFDRVEPPRFPSTPDWKTYSPSTEYSSQETYPFGKKQFEQAVVAKNSSLKQIPSLSFSYFDPEKESYITVASAPIAVNIAEPDSSVTPQQQLTATAVKPQSAQPASEAVESIKGLAPLHLETGTLYQSIMPLYKKTWFLAAVGCCLLLLLFVFFFKLRISNLEKHPELQLQKRRQELLTGDLAKLSQARDSGDGSLFLALCRHSIQQQLGLLWQVEGTAISLADIKNRLGDTTDLIEIFAVAEQAAYGTSQLSSETMQIYFEQLKRELEELI